MAHTISKFLGFQGPRKATAAQGPRELQTVQEVDYERQTFQHDTEVLPIDVLVRPEPNPSQRPLGRIAHDPADTFGRQNDVAAKRSIYAQEGDVEPREFKETVAELLKEEEYGLFRLVVPSVEIGRQEFDEYVAWLNKQKPEGERAVHRSILGVPVIRPFTVTALAWTSLMSLVDLTWTAFGVPINVAFCSVNYGRIDSPCTGSDLSFGIIYLLNLLMGFVVGILVVNGHRKKVVMDGRRVAWYYVRHGRFVLDVASTVPFVYLIVVLATSGGEGYRAKWVNAVSLIRLLRLLRLVSVSKVIYIDSALGSASWLARYLRVSTLHVLLVGFQTLVLMNLIACVLVLLAYMHGLDESWMTAVSWTDVASASRVYQWYCAMYWVVTTTTTTGFGDFSPRWWAEQVVIGLAMVGGMIAFGILVGSVANALARADSTASRLQNHIRKISQVNNWLSASKLRENTKLKIQEYYAQLYVAKQSVEYGEAELFADLPPYLKYEVAGDLALPLVQNVHALKDLNQAAQQLLAGHMKPLRATVGQELCRQGDEADRLWLLSSGELVALRHKEAPQHVSAPALVGESLILAIDIPQCRHRPWTLRASLPCQLWEMRLEDLSRVIQIYPAVRLSLLDHVRKALVKSSFSTNDDGNGPALAPVTQDWCELSALLQSALLELQEVDPAALDELYRDLVKANIDDSSLQARLSEIVEAAMVRDGLTPEAVLGLPLPVQEQLQRQTVSITAGHRSGNGNNGGKAQPGSAQGIGPYARGDSVPNGFRRGDGGGGGLPYMHRQATHDSHRGPAPWGVATEDVLASRSRFANPPPPPPAQSPPPLPQQQPQPQPQLPPLPPAVADAPRYVREESSKSWHGRPSPPRPSPPRPPPGPPFRRVASHHQGLTAAAVSDSGRSSASAGGAVGGGAFDEDNDIREAAASGLNTPEMGMSRQAAPPMNTGGGSDGATGLAGLPQLSSAASAPPSQLPEEILDDPIAAETAVLSPSAQRRQQQQEEEEEQLNQVLELPPPPPPPSQHRPHLPPPLRHVDLVEGRMAAEPPASAFASSAATAAAAAAAAAAAPTPHRSSSMTSHVVGAAGPGPLRSKLSRMSSPFDVLPPAVSSSSAAPGAGGPSSSDGGRPHAQALVSASSGTCAACGACFCSQCGAWTTHGSHPQAASLPGHHAHGNFTSALPPIGFVGVGGAPPALSLMDAIRGAGGGTAAANAAAAAAAAGGGGGGGGGGGAGPGFSSVRRRGNTPWGVQQLNAPPSPRQLTPWGAAPGSPMAALSRRSRMYGRSFAATLRADSLIRNTLWNAYSQNDTELASPSEPMRAAEDD